MVPHTPTMETPPKGERSDTGPPDRLITSLAWAGMLAGCLVRIAEFLQHPALWVDEARVALNVGSRSWLGLVAPLDHDQTAPVPFLWALRLSTLLGGVNDRSLRVVALLAALALLPALWWVGRRMFGARVAALAVALAAFSPPLVRYANEVKQYQTDALATVAALALYFVTLPRLHRPWTGVALAAGGAILLWSSQTVSLVLAGVAVALLLYGVQRRTVLPNVLLAGGAWVVTFAALYFLSYRDVAASDYMHVFWGDTFLTPRAEDFRFRLFWAGSSLLTTPIPGPKFLLPTEVYALVFLLGLWWAGRGGKIDRVALLGVPFVALAGVATLGLYPIAERLVLFLVPLLFLTYANALDGATRILKVGRPGYIAVLSLILLAGGWTSRRVFHSEGPWNARSMVDFLRREGGMDPVYLYAGGIPAWAFYTTDWASPDHRRLERFAHIAAAGGPAFENAPPRGRAVECEGDELTESWNGRLVLLGVPAGIQAREPKGWTQAQPDSGWADNEARRIRRIPAGRVWVLAVHYEDRWIDELVTALEAGGAVLQSRRAARGDEYGAALYELALPSDAPLPKDGCGNT